LKRGNSTHPTNWNPWHYSDTTARSGKSHRQLVLMYEVQQLATLHRRTRVPVLIEIHLDLLHSVQPAWLRIVSGVYLVFQFRQNRTQHRINGSFQFGIGIGPRSVGTV